MALLFSAFLSTGALGATLLDPDPTPEPGATQFGRAVLAIDDINGDGVRDIVASAPFQDGDFDHPGASVDRLEFGPPQNVGKVWVLSGADLSIIRVLDDPKFQMPAEEKFGDQFGNCLVNAGDLNGDGVSDIIVGLWHRVLEDPVEDEEAFNAGQAMVFSGSDGTLLYTVGAPEAHENGKFGTAAAGMGDLNGDGVPDFIVGEPKNDGEEEAEEEEEGIPDVGTVYVFNGATGTVMSEIHAPELEGEEANGLFGTALANAGDLDGDGLNDFIAGAPGIGRVYAISSATGEPIFTVVSPQTEKLPSFGAAVAAGKDVNNDGIPDFVVGAPLQNGLAGAASVFSGSNGRLIKRLTAAPEAFAKFGASVAMTNDLSGDGRPDIIVGAPDHSVNGLLNAGEAFIFNGRNGQLVRTVTAAAPTAYAGFGTSVEAAVLQGSTVSLLIGAPYQDAEIFDPDTGDFETHLQIGQLEIQ
jgi:hypothetical protein